MVKQVNLIPVLISFLLLMGEISCSRPEKDSLPINPSLTQKTWPAVWITSPEATAGYGVYFFHKKFTLPEKPGQFIIHVTADNRYVLYVNGKRITHGPVPGDLKHWFFETLDIAPYLNKGVNCIAAVVWNYGDYKPWCQISAKTAFLVQGNSFREEMVNTDTSWKTTVARAYAPCIPSKQEFAFSYGTGAYERVDFSSYEWGWELADHSLSHWQTAIPAGIASMQPSESPWILEQRQIPLMEYREERFGKIVSIKGTDWKNFITGNDPLTIPAHRRVSILIDKGHVTTAFPRLTFSKGKGSTIKITYNESLYSDTTLVEHGNSYRKGNRSETRGKFMKGLYDLLLPDGGEKRTYEPLAYRTYRFVLLDITTGNEELILEDYKEYFSAYPFVLKASFRCSDTILNRLFEMGWRTVRLCSHENYIDCPYYEQLQYFGDLNITARVSACLSEDARLIRQTLLHGLAAMDQDSIINAAYPSRTKNIIPAFSFSWIHLATFYGHYTGDRLLIKKLLPAVEKIMVWYENKLDKQHYLLGPMPYWNFIDCTKEWPWKGTINGSCEPPGKNEGHSAVLTLQYLWGLQTAEHFMLLLNEKHKASHYHALASAIQQALVSSCWNPQRHLFADTPEKTSYSQHANIMALATGSVPPVDVDSCLYHLMYDRDLVQASLQFRAYLHMGLARYGKISSYLRLLDPWRQLISMGCTTFPEYPTDDNRSETHGWNTFPVLELLTIACGISLPEPATQSVTIAPHPDTLSWIEGSLPWKNQLIKVAIKQKPDGGIHATVVLPEGLKGVFKFKNKSIELHQGEQSINIP